MLRTSGLVALLLPGLCEVADAQEMAPPLAAASASSGRHVDNCCTAPAGALVTLAVTPLLSSKTAKQGDLFALRLVEPLVVDGKPLLPAGVPGMGEVIHAASAGLGGKPGELLLAARYLQHGDRRIPLKAMKLGATGKAPGASVLAGSMSVAALAFIPGGEVQVPAGARANARLAMDLTLPPIAPASAP